MPYRILLRRDLSQNWNYNDPVLMSGEPGYEMDNRKFKMGDGQTPWSQLPYYCGVTGPTGNTGPIGVTGPTGAFADFHVYDYEIHVSGIDGSDTLGNGNLLNPVASITKALTLISTNRKTIIIHPGVYTESPSITTQSTVLTTYEPLGENTSIIGTVSTSVGCTIIGLTIQNLTITAGSGVGVPTIVNSTISGTLTKSGNAALVDIKNCIVNTSLNVTGPGIVSINDGNPNFITVNNASANVIVKNTIHCLAPGVVAGSLRIADSILIASTTYAITSNPGSVITLANCQCLNSALDNVAPVSLNGFYSILNCVYNKTASSLAPPSITGGTTNSISYSQYINADKFITQGGTSSQYVKGDGSLSSAPYKVFTALVTQAGTSSILNQDIGGLGKGITYRISVNSPGMDFTNIGAPNNNIGTYFISSANDSPASWGSLAGTGNNTIRSDSGAPVVNNILENTIGNIWFTYNNVGIYDANSNGLFTSAKTINTLDQTVNLSTDTEGTYNVVCTNPSININRIQIRNASITSVDDQLYSKLMEIRVYN